MATDYPSSPISASRAFWHADVLPSFCPEACCALSRLDLGCAMPPLGPSSPDSRSPSKSAWWLSQQSSSSQLRTPRVIPSLQSAWRLPLTAPPPETGDGSMPVFIAMSRKTRAPEKRTQRKTANVERWRKAGPPQIAAQGRCP